jgi:hypothetical protein
MGTWPTRLGAVSDETVINVYGSCATWDQWVIAQLLQIHPLLREGTLHEDTRN